jgi:hypothetical protein
MSASTLSAPAHSRSLGRSAAAFAVAIIANVVLSVGTDQVLHVLHVYPPWGEPMYDASLNLLALSYRVVFSILSGYLVARLAPHSPMRHTVILGAIAVVLSALGVVATLTQELGPVWYPIALAVLAFPCVWIGGILHEQSAGSSV